MRKKRAWFPNSVVSSWICICQFCKSLTLIPQYPTTWLVLRNWISFCFHIKPCWLLQTVIVCEIFRKYVILMIRMNEWEWGWGCRGGDVQNKQGSESLGWTEWKDKKKVILSWVRSQFEKLKQIGHVEILR